MAFEQLMAEAAKKQEKKKDKETAADNKKKEKDHVNHHHSHNLNPFASAKPPEGMSEAEAKEKAHAPGRDQSPKQ